MPKDGRDLAVEAATEGLPGGRGPQAERDRQPEGVAEGKHCKDGAAREPE